MLLLALAVFLGMLAIYLFTLSQNYSTDAMAFATLASQGDLSQPLLFQAEHLLYPFTGWLWYQVWVFFGYRAGALNPLQVLNATLGAAGVAFFFLAMRLALGGASRAVFISLIFALALGSSYGYWYHSTEGEDQVIANALVLGALLAFLAWRILRQQDELQERRRSELALTLTALVSGLAVLSHATQVLFLPLLAAGLWHARATRREWLITIGVLAVAIGIPYLLVGSLIHDYRTPGDFLGWLLAAPGHGIWGQPGWRSPWQALQTLVGTLLYLGEGPDFRSLLTGQGFRTSNLVAILLFMIMFAGLVHLLLYLVRHRQHLATSGTVRLLALWVVVYGIFNVYWAPEDIQFWVAVLPACLGLAAFAYAHLLQHFPRREEFLHSLSAFGLASLFMINLTTVVLPRAQIWTNQGYFKALCVGQFAGPTDLVITPGWDWASAYVPYFTGRRVLSLADANLMIADREPERLSAVLREQVEQTRQAGGRVYVVRLFSLSDTDRTWLRRVAGPLVEAFPFATRPVGQCGNESIWEITD